MINERERELWADRIGLDYEYGRKPGEVATPLKTIRKKCIECSCGSMSEVRKCTVVQCWCWPWRFGHRPKKEE